MPTQTNSQPSKVPTGDQTGVPVTADNFVRAETDMYFAEFAKRGGFGKFSHARDLPLGEKTGVRPNRDTLYSLSVYDLDAGPVTITLPDAGKRFMTMMVVDQDHYVSLVTYGKGTHTLDRKAIGTRYVFAAIRTLVNPADPEDFKQAHALQDAVRVSQQSAGKVEMPNWDPVSQKKVRDALLVLNETLPDLRRAGGRREEVDPVRHLIATASAWGLNPDADAIYLNVTPARNDGATVYRLNVKDVPVDGFWSVIVYDERGLILKNSLDAYSLSNITAKKGTDGSVAIQFGGCDGKTANCLPIMKGWNYMVRLYRPRPEIVDGTWKFPEAQVVGSATSQPLDDKPGRTTATAPLPVTADNFNRAESDMYFSGVVKQGALGRFHHVREPMSIDKQDVIRGNRDTLYSSAVFDLDAGPVTVALPDPGGRFMSMIVLNEDQYALTTGYAPGSFTYTKDQVGTRYVLIGLRTLVDPNDPKDLERVHALQDAVKSDQKGVGKFEIPNWDPVSQKKVRDALLVLAGTLPDTKRMYGPKDRVEPIRHLIGTATGWGANAPEDAIYIPVVPPKNDGTTVHRLNIKGEVPVDGFWSISVYGADGYFHKNDRDAYSINNVTAKKDADGSVTIQFGGCDGKVPNCLPIEPGWNYWVRFYRPRAEIVNGSYVLPEAQPVTGKTASTPSAREAEREGQGEARL